MQLILLTSGTIALVPYVGNWVENKAFWSKICKICVQVINLNFLFFFFSGDNNDMSIIQGGTNAKTVFLLVRYYKKEQT